jgi:hypothetical protein
MKNNEQIGDMLDDFLQEEGFLAEAEAVAIKRIMPSGFRN